MERAGRGRENDERWGGGEGGVDGKKIMKPFQRTF